MPGDIVKRLVTGFDIVTSRIIRSYGYAEFVMLYSIAIGVLVSQNRTRMINALRSPGHRRIFLFIVLYFTGYLLLYLWYASIAPGNRFVLTLLMPLLYVFTWILSFARRHKLYYTIGHETYPVQIIRHLILLILMIYVVGVYPHRTATMFGGR
ncbi:MAG: hypothetical protein P1S60_11515 [Anaerolineae bacterium]|nr:hypothetical protein [Anaerolineae bacterium]